MNVGFIHWYAVVAPLWIASLIWNMQLALLQFFSVPLMLRTLFSHWRKDAVAYRGTISSRLLAFAWNNISRGIGFVIRSFILLAWLGSELLFLFFAVSFFVLFAAWPALVILGFFTSFWLFFQYA